MPAPVPLGMGMNEECDDDLEQFNPQNWFSDSCIPPVHLPLNLGALSLNKPSPISSKRDSKRSVNVDTSSCAPVSTNREERPTTVADVLTDVSCFEQAYRAYTSQTVALPVEH